MAKVVLEQAIITEKEFKENLNSIFDHVHDTKEPTVVVLESGKELEPISKPLG